MPLDMDVHEKIEGLTAEAVAQAHAKNLEVQAADGVKYLKYRFDERTGKVFCLVEAPSFVARASRPKDRNVSYVSEARAAPCLRSRPTPPHCDGPNASAWSP
jgi:Nickel responsive protein SCO4226-like